MPRECCKESKVPLGKVSPARECYEMARESCKESKVHLGKVLPARECYETPRECCKESKDGKVRLGKVVPYLSEIRNFIPDSGILKSGENPENVSEFGIKFRIFGQLFPDFL